MDQEDFNANITHDSVDEDSNPALTSSSNEWVMDSACTFHMCPKKEWFYNLVESKVGSVRMGNNQICEISGIGQIKLKLLDGIVRILNVVLYVPNLKSNLISLGSLESKGFKIVMENGILKVLSGAAILLIATRRRNMYFLKGSTVVDGTTTISNTTREVASNTTRLLGHARENTLNESAKTCKLEFCKSSVLEKQTRIKFGHHTKGILDFVHKDVREPPKAASLGGRQM